MSELQKSMAELIERLEAEGKGVGNLAELEQVVLRYSQELSRAAYQELSREVQERTPPPREVLS